MVGFLRRRDGGCIPIGIVTKTNLLQIGEDLPGRAPCLIIFKAGILREWVAQGIEVTLTVITECGNSCACIRARGNRNWSPLCIVTKAHRGKFWYLALSYPPLIVYRCRSYPAHGRGGGYCAVCCILFNLIN